MALTTWDEIVASTMRSDKTIREQLQDAIYNVSPYETPLLSRLASVPVKNTHVQWLVDAYAAAAHQASIEGIAFTANTLTVPTRASNLTQQFIKGGEISDTQRQVEHAGMTDPVMYYEGKHVVEIKRDIELSIVRGSAATGDTDTALQMNGFLNFISTNKTDMSGVTLTELQFNNILEMVWGNTAMFPTEVYVGPKLKRTISQFTTSVTRNVDASAKKQVLTISQYDSDFGVENIVLHRDLLSASATANEMLIIDPNWFATGWLKPLQREVFPRTGLTTRYMMNCALTVLFRNEKAAAAVTNLRPYIV